jgi:glycerol-3-phosphate acyltransferase PlsX
MKELGAINFAGNVEARDLPRGICDVVVTDGLVGNVIIKLTEGLGTHLLRQIKQMFTSNLTAKIGAVFLANQLRKMQAETDYSSYGGAPILGVKKPLIKTHGSSSAETIKNAVIKSVEFVKQNAIETIEGAMVEIEKFEIVE